MLWHYSNVFTQKGLGTCDRTVLSYCHTFPTDCLPNATHSDHRASLALVDEVLNASDPFPDLVRNGIGIQYLTLGSVQAVMKRWKNVPDRANMADFLATTRRPRTSPGRHHKSLTPKSSVIQLYKPIDRRGIKFSIALYELLRPEEKLSNGYIRQVKRIR